MEHKTEILVYGGILSACLIAGGTYLNRRDLVREKQLNHSIMLEYKNRYEAHMQVDPVTVVIVADRNKDCIADSATVSLGIPIDLKSIQPEYESLCKEFKK